MERTQSKDAVRVHKSASAGLYDGAFFRRFFTVKSIQNMTEIWISCLSLLDCTRCMMWMFFDGPGNISLVMTETVMMRLDEHIHVHACVRLHIRETFPTASATSAGDH